MSDELVRTGRPGYGDLIRRCAIIPKPGICLEPLGFCVEGA